MEVQVIHKVMVESNLVDYERECREFSWEAARRGLAGLPDGRGLNITYDGLRRLTNKFANVLRGLGIGRGDRVASLLGRVPEPEEL